MLIAGGGQLDAPVIKRIANQIGEDISFSAHRHFVLAISHFVYIQHAKKDRRM
jgi:hypothetical protein